MYISLTELGLQLKINHHIPTSHDECLLSGAAIKVATVRINEVVTISHIRVCC